MKVGFTSRYSFCCVILHGTTNLFSDFQPKLYLFPEPATYVYRKMGAVVPTRLARSCS